MAKYLDEKKDKTEKLKVKVERASNKITPKRKKGEEGEEIKVRLRKDNDNEIKNETEDEYVNDNIYKIENDCKNEYKCSSDIKNNKKYSNFELPHDETSIDSKVEKWNNFIMADKSNFSMSDNRNKKNDDDDYDNDNMISNDNSNNNKKYKNQIFQKNRNSQVYWCNKSIENLGHLFTLDSHVAVEALNPYNGFVPIVTATANASVSTDKHMEQSTYDVCTGTENHRKIGMLKSRADFFILVVLNLQE